MVRRIRRKFSAEFKQEAVRRVNDDRRSMKAVADELGVHALVACDAEHETKRGATHSR